MVIAIRHASFSLYVYRKINLQRREKYMKIKEGDKLPEAKVLIINMNKEYEHKEIPTSGILNNSTSL